MNPDDLAGIMVHNDSDIFVALLVAGLIDADAHQSIETALWIEVRILPDPTDDRTDSVP